MRRFAKITIKQRIITLNPKKALLVFGAPKVGKTWLIQEALSSLGVPYLTIDLLTNPMIRSALSVIDDPKDIVNYLVDHCPVPLIKGQGIIFFDHIQACPSLLSKIKGFVQEGSYRYVLSGSLASIDPSCYEFVSPLRIYPMTFLEFALAYGLSEAKFNHLKDCFAKRVPVDPTVHLEVLNPFHYYLVCGGFPEAVLAFIAHKNLNELNKVHRRIVAAYKQEFTRYGKRRDRITSLYDNIPCQINKANRKFKFTLFDQEMKFTRDESLFCYLDDIGAAYLCYQRKDATSIKRNSFKLYLNDVGLLMSSFSRQQRERMALGIEANTLDGVYENFVASMLRSQSIKSSYYKQKDIGEVDFLVDTSWGLTAIEVQSGADYAKHKALDISD